MTKDELKDELKDRISMALKDPILQQGFEIICKNLAELEKACDETQELLDKQIEATFKLVKENAELKAGKDMNVATKWHDLRKDPTDVPKENVTVLLLTEVEPVTARYDNEYEAFFRLNNKLDYCVFIAPIGYIAWCEIPEYTEE